MSEHIGCNLRAERMGLQIAQLEAGLAREKWANGQAHQAALGFVEEVEREKPTDEMVLAVIALRKELESTRLQLNQAWIDRDEHLFIRNRISRELADKAALVARMREELPDDEDHTAELKQARAARDEILNTASIWCGRAHELGAERDTQAALVARMRETLKGVRLRFMEMLDFYVRQQGPAGTGDFEIALHYIDRSIAESAAPEGGSGNHTPTLDTAGDQCAQCREPWPCRAARTAGITDLPEE